MVFKIQNVVDTCSKCSIFLVDAFEIWLTFKNKWNLKRLAIQNLLSCELKKIQKWTCIVELCVMNRNYAESWIPTLYFVSKSFMTASCNLMLHLSSAGSSTWGCCVNWDWDEFVMIEIQSSLLNEEVLLVLWGCSSRGHAQQTYGGPIWITRWCSEIDIDTNFNWWIAAIAWLYHSDSRNESAPALNLLKKKENVPIKWS